MLYQFFQITCKSIKIILETKFGNHAADLRLSFCICKKQVFSRRSSFHIYLPEFVQRFSQSLSKQMSLQVRITQLIVPGLCKGKKYLFLKSLFTLFPGPKVCVNVNDWYITGKQLGTKQHLNGKLLHRFDRLSGHT